MADIENVDHLSTMPEEVLHVIFAYLTFNDVTTKRLLNQRLNSVCGSVLTRGLNGCIQATKRELTRHSNKPSSTRYKVLVYLASDMHDVKDVFETYIKRKNCQFIPGKVYIFVFSTPIQKLI